MAGLTKQAIDRLLSELNEELVNLKAEAELYLVGGAVMTLVFEARPATKDIDALFHPQAVVRKAALRVAHKNSLNESWLNDAAKGFLSENRDFAQFRDLSNLRVFVPSTEYLFAMKCLAMRLGPEFADEEDVRFLARALNLNSSKQALEIISQYYPLERLHQKTFYALEEILSFK
jgi:hypothetical protein